MGHSKLIHEIVEQIKVLMKEYKLYHRDYKFVRLSSGNLQIINKELNKSCILYVNNYCQSDIKDEVDSWYKHKLYVVKKLKDKHFDSTFKIIKKKISFDGVIGPFEKHPLKAEIPAVVKETSYGENFILPRNVIIRKIVIKRNIADKYITEGTSIVFGLANSCEPKLLTNFENLHKEPGILSERVNKDNIINITTVDVDTQSENKYVVAKCALGKEINTGSIYIRIKCYEICE